ncbi:MAG: endonuclease/exonuclease/phosphatase family protein [Anaerolineae bacterium]
MIMHRALKTLNRAGIAAVMLYTATLAILEAIRRLPKRAELRGLLGTQQSILLLAAPYLLPLGVLLRPHGIGLALAPALAAWVVHYGPLLVFKWRSAPPWAPRLTVLTFNLHAPERGFAALAAVIRRAGADIVALQEVSHAAAECLTPLLRDIYPYQALHPHNDGPVGQGLLSRHPIVADTYWRNTSLDVYLGHQRSQVDFLGTRLAVYNAHPVPPFMFRRPLTLFPHSAEMHEVLERIADEDDPLLLMGDMNMTDRFDLYHQITTRLTDAFRQAGRGGLGLTFPANSRLVPPIVRLDYIFHDHTFRTICARTLQSGGSDHRPVWAELALPLLAKGRHALVSPAPLTQHNG